MLLQDNHTQLCKLLHIVGDQFTKFSAIDDDGIKTTVANIMSGVLSQSLAVCLNWFGRGNKGKLAFGDTKHLQLVTQLCFPFASVLLSRPCCSYVALSLM